VRRRAAGADQGAPAALDAEEAKAATVIVVVLAAAMLLHRVAIPAGGFQLSVVAPIALGAFAWGIYAGVLRIDALRVQLYLLAVAACSLASLITLWRGISWSLVSLIFLFAIYVPFVLGLVRPTRRVLERCATFFLRVVLVGAVAGLVQFFSQLAGLGYPDPLGLLPPELQLEGFVTTYPIYYGSDLLKANGMIFLEASFLSQFCALALILHIYLGRRGPAPVVYIAAMLASVSGTGILLAAVGLLGLGFARHGRRVAYGLGLAAAAVLLVSLAPFGSIFEERASDPVTAYPRFVTPYTHMMSTVEDDAASFLFGTGAGNEGGVDAAAVFGEPVDVTEVPDVTGADAIPPTNSVIPKLVLDYGVLAAAVFLVFVLACTLAPGVSYLLAAILLFQYLTLSGNLLHPSTVYILLVFTTFFAGAAGVRRAKAVPGRLAPAPSPRLTAP
jgi:hypothetical protein